MKTFIIIGVLAGAIFFGLYQLQGMAGQKEMHPDEKISNTRFAVFAGGCFWCTESDFEKVPGVIDAISGYTGGHVKNPTYEETSSGTTGHVEAVKVLYDPRKVTYEQLLDWFWHHVNPTDAGGQFVDRGTQYRSVIFYADAHERQLAEASRESLAASGVFNEPIVTEILPLGPFYPAEEYHQNYHTKNPIRYKFYRYNSGRDRFLEKTLNGKQDILMPKMHHMMKPEETMDMPKEMTENMSGDKGMQQMYAIPGKAELKKKLTPMQYDVTRENGTEPPFNNAYWDKHQPGIYVDIVSGEPLFSSLDKFDSGTGWPSFTRPLEPDNIVEKTDKGFFTTRTEVRSRHADSHLGHVFDDGPPPTGLRYCINSAALRFVPKADLEKDRYGKYLHLFQ